MTLEEFLINNQIAFKRNDGDELIINTCQDYRIQVNNLSRVGVSSIVGMKFMGASTFHKEKVIVIEFKDGD